MLYKWIGKCGGSFGVHRKIEKLTSNMKKKRKLANKIKRIQIILIPSRKTLPLIENYFF